MTKVLVNFIQDRSGSMANVWQETLSGFRAFVTELRDKGKQEGVDYLFSLTTFDTLIETPLIAQPIGSVNVEELAKHGPRGMTALYDAVGTTIQNTDENHHDAEKIIVVIVTDGQENSSREWDKDKLHTVVDSKLKAGNWTFTYLGTQPETWADAGAIGMAMSAHGYSGDMAAAAYVTMAAGVHRLSKSPRASSPDLMTDWLTKEERQAAGITDRDDNPPSKAPLNAEEIARRMKQRLQNWRKP